MAQLVAHLHGMQGVRGSNPLSSTKIYDRGSHLKSKKYVKVANYFVSLLIVLSSFLIFLQVSVPLFDINVTEVDKKKVIGMTISAPIEFDSGTEFWWLIKPENTINFANASDERINGTITLKISDNPCKSEEVLKVMNENATQIITLSPNIVTKIQIPLAIEPKSSRQVKIIFDSKKECLVKNGDKRNFGAKLNAWKYE